MTTVASQILQNEENLEEDTLNELSSNELQKAILSLEDNGYEIIRVENDGHVIVKGSKGKQLRIQIKAVT